MNLMPITENEKKINNYLDKIEYKGFYKFFSEKATCIDQKCTFDLLWINCLIIIQYFKEKKIKFFCIKDFFQYEYSKKIITDKTEFIGKAIIKLDTLREFDKFFGQIYEMLSYVEILKKIKKGNTRYFEILNFEILEILANDENACLFFMCKHVLKLFKEEKDLNEYLIEIKDSPNEIQKKWLIEKIRQWINISSNGSHKKDVKQISLKLINPIYYIYKYKKYHSNKNNKDFPQSINDLRYIRLHPRYRTKSFRFTQVQHIEYICNNKNESKTENDNKKLVKKWNNERFYKYKNVFSDVNKYCSELSQKIILNPDIHHILMKNIFEKSNNHLKNSVENLILLDPNEHRSIPTQYNNDYILYTFQKILPKQYVKIVDFTNSSIGKYDIFKFYDLVCLAIQLFFDENYYNKYDKNSWEICSGKIADLLNYWNTLLSK